LAHANAIGLAGTTRVLYEVHELECDDAESQCRTFKPEPSFITQFVLPIAKVSKGDDVETFSAGTGAECSPLACNASAADVETNQHCVLISFERANQLLEEGKFKNTEPGPYRIFAVYTVEWP